MPPPIAASDAMVMIVAMFAWLRASPVIFRPSSLHMSFEPMQCVSSASLYDERASSVRYVATPRPARPAAPTEMPMMRRVRPGGDGDAAVGLGSTTFGVLSTVVPTLVFSLPA